MIEWYTWLAVTVCLAAAAACLVQLAMRRPVNDISLGAAAAVELLLLVQAVIAIVAPLAGNPPSGDLVEFWMYLVCALLIPPAAAFWALLNRGRASNAILLIALLAVAVMVYRMFQIWVVQGA